MRGGLILLGLVLLVVYGLFDPAQVALFPSCPLRTATGLPCPGCGSQRAIHDLLHGHLAAALAHNALLVLALPYLLLGIYMEYAGGKYRHTQLYHRLFGKTAALIWLALVLAFWGWRLV